MLLVKVILLTSNLIISLYFSSRPLPVKMTTNTNNFTSSKTDSGVESLLLSWVSEKSYRLTSHLISSHLHLSRIEVLQNEAKIFLPDFPQNVKKTRRTANMSQSAPKFLDINFRILQENTQYKERFKCKAWWDRKQTIQIGKGKGFFVITPFYLSHVNKNGDNFVFVASYKQKLRLSTSGQELSRPRHYKIIVFSNFHKIYYLHKV